MTDHAEATHPIEHDMTEGDDLDYRAIAVFLWSLLDDIDTASDQAKSNDVAYRNMAEKIQRRRFDVSTSDGYEIAFTSLPNKDAEMNDESKTPVVGGNLLADQGLSVGGISGGADQIQFKLPRTVTLFRDGFHVTYEAVRLTVFEDDGTFNEQPIVALG